MNSNTKPHQLLNTLNGIKEWWKQQITPSLITLGISNMDLGTLLGSPPFHPTKP